MVAVIKVVQRRTKTVLLDNFNTTETSTKTPDQPRPTYVPYHTTHINLIAYITIHKTIHKQITLLKMTNDKLVIYMI